MCWSKRWGGYLQIAPPFWRNFDRISIDTPKLLGSLFSSHQLATPHLVLEKRKTFFTERHFFSQHVSLLGSSIKNDQNRLSMTESSCAPPQRRFFEEFLNMHWSGTNKKKTPTFFDVVIFGKFPNFPKVATFWGKSVPLLGKQSSPGWLDCVDSGVDRGFRLGGRSRPWNRFKKSVHEKSLKLLFRSCWRRLVGWLGKRDFPSEISLMEHLILGSAW